MSLARDFPVYFREAPTFFQSLGGNIVTGSPISDLVPLLMASGATALLQTIGVYKSVVIQSTQYLTPII